MTGGKKVLNVFGIIFAWILSVVLVVALITAPIVFSTLSLFNADNLANTLTQIDYSALFEDTRGDDFDVDADLDDSIDVESGDKTESVNSKAINAFMRSSAGKEVIAAYINDFSDDLSGKPAEKKLTADQLKKIINNNLDEIVEIVKQNYSEYADTPEAEIKQMVTDVFEENAEQIIENLPSGEEVRELVGEENIDSVALVFSASNDHTVATLPIISVIVLIVALIFVCRLFDLRGFKWLAINMFVSSGVLSFICVGLFAGSSLITRFVPDGAINLISVFISTLKSGLVVRTAIILVIGVMLLLAYVLINNAKEKKLQKSEI